MAPESYSKREQMCSDDSTKWVTSALIFTESTTSPSISLIKYLEAKSETFVVNLYNFQNYQTNMRELPFISPFTISVNRLSWMILFCVCCGIIQLVKVVRSIHTPESSHVLKGSNFEHLIYWVWFRALYCQFHSSTMVPWVIFCMFRCYLTLNKAQSNHSSNLFNEQAT